MKKNRRIFGKTVMILSLIFFYLPIICVVVFSFNGSKSLTVMKGFSLQWYERLFRDSQMMESVYTTVLVAVIATVVSTLTGTLAAVGLSKSRRVVKDLVLQINDFPIMNPEIVTAIGLMLFFITIGVERGLMTMILAHIAFCIPYVILSVMPKIRSLDPNLADAAMDLGATPWQALTKVIVPEIMPGVFSGALIAFTMSFDDFIISYFVTGRGVKNLSIMVYTMSKRVNPTINAISSLIVGVITLVLIIINLVPFIRERSLMKKQKAAAAKAATTKAIETDAASDAKAPDFKE
ncbi:MAG: ABC transporter permease [Lachnospiraceae bacterium]|nr:ABC transporter permease [Lachnospiraceae bacterium]